MSAASSDRLRRLADWLRGNPIFIATVIVPTLLALLYLGLYASDIYVCESRFVIRSPQRPAQSGLFGSLLQSTGFVHSQDDTYLVRDFILSRDAAAELDRSLAIRSVYGASTIDRPARFAGVVPDSSFEAFYRYYGRHVAVDYDPVSSISILTVRAFGANESVSINERLLQMSERLVNELNVRSRHDLVRYAEADVEVAARRARDAALALSRFRGGQAVYEPNAEAGIQLQSIARLEGDLLAATTALEQLRKLAPENPQVAALTIRQATIREAIRARSAQVTESPRSLSATAPGYERLALESTLADKQLATALASLESARSDALRKQLYLERIVQPGRPDRAMEPRRLRGVFTVLLFGLIAWGVAGLLYASVREHTD